METIIEEATDEVVERRSRRIHLVESVTATVGAWHGGRKVGDLGCYTGVVHAVRRAEEAVREFGLGPSSTMRIRIEEKAVRHWRALRGIDRWGDATYESQDARPSFVARHRHAWDDLAGLLEARWRPWEFEVEEWVGYKDDPPPRSVIAGHYSSVSVEGCRDGDLHALFGTGLPVLQDIACDAAPPPDALARLDARRPMRGYVRVRLRGCCHVTALPCAGVPDVAAFLGRLDVRPQRDSNGWGALDLASPGCTIWSDPERGNAAAWRPGNGTPLLA